MAKILSRLRGGDRRSIGNVSEVVAAVRKKPEGVSMKNEQVEDQWVWVVVQDPGEKEQFLGQHNEQEDISFIPAFHSKEEAQQCLMDMPRRKGRKYEVQAILLEELSIDAAAGGFMIFLLNENGEVLERIKP